MTAMQNTRNLESQKQRYSRELAAYTLQQWNTARQALESSEHTPQERSSSRSRRSSSAQREQSRSSRSQGVHSIDYARMPVNHADAGNYEGRTVATGN
ncbi:hypothetical protein B0H21DRAFT_737594 [Amylocystis lapponica]|nr:hypothetical protein B0H21DRAFT_737594 [Amylocystis lapponica]